MQRILLTLIFLCVFAANIFLVSTTYSAAGSIWISENKITIVSENVDRQANISDFFNGCIEKQAQVSNTNRLHETKDICSIESSTISFGVYVSDRGNYAYAAKIAGDDIFRPIENVKPPWQKMYYFPNINKVIVFDKTPTHRSPSDPFVYAIDDIVGSLKEAEHNYLTNETATYNIETSNRRTFLRYPFISSPDEFAFPSVESLVFSKNGEHFSANVGYRGHVVVDTSTGAAKSINVIAGSPYSGIDTPQVSAVSDDGRFVYIENLNYMYDTYNCGDEFSRDFADRGLPAYEINKPCPYNDFNEQLNEALPYRFNGTKYSFEDDDKSLYFTILPGQAPDGLSKSVIVKSPQSSSVNKLDYLALGDSYSSGEGDIGRQANGTSYYTPISAGLNGCHLSTRSYPFVLKHLTNISDSRMQSIACSGAQVSKDYHGSSDSYLGQGNRLKSKSTTELANERINALTEFRPGVLKQVDFIRANQPKVVTLTGGGNDVGFGKIMSYCAHIWHENKLTGTCDYAKKGSKLHGVLANSIKSQYRSTRELIEKIKEASPDTTIYIVGYPSFVASKTGCVNDAALNTTEVSMLNESIAYMNDTLDLAAKSKGAKFVDVEQSFHGGRICEGSTYMTGPAALLSGAQLQEAFHPNAAGNEKLAQTILDGGFTIQSANNPIADSSVSEPSAPSFFAPANNGRVEQATMAPYASKRGQKVQLSLVSLLLRPAAPITFTLYSNPTKLGTYKVAADGSFNKEVTIPNSIEPGYHVLLAETQASDSTPLTFYQFIEVAGTSTTDIDGDGIPNDKDKCQYLAHWYDEATKKDICKVATAHQPGTGQHGGHWTSNGHGHTSGSHHIHGLFARYWKDTRYFHSWLGVAFCIGLFVQRFR